MVNDESFGILSFPVTDRQLWMFTLIGDSSHENRIFFGTEFMGEHLRKVTGDLYWLEMIVKESIGRLGPFQNDIRSFFPMECEESAIQMLTFLLQHTHLDLNASLTEFSNASPLNFSEFIDATYNHTPYTFLYNKVGTRWCLTIVGTRLQRDIYR